MLHKQGPAISRLLDAWIQQDIKTYIYHKFSIISSRKKTICQQTTKNTWFTTKPLLENPFDNTKLASILLICKIGKYLKHIFQNQPIFPKWDVLNLLVWCLNSGPDTKLSNIYSCICWGIFTPEETICEFYFDVNFKTWFFWGIQKYICLKYNSIL